MASDKRLFSSILCPVDFSEHSREALRYAALLTSRAKGSLIVIYVEDPMLAAAAAVAYDERKLRDKARTELRRFVQKPIARYGLRLEAITLDIAVGKPHEEIGWTAERVGCDLIVMGAHGLTAARRMLIGSTTHRILRESVFPVLATPPVGRRAAPPSRRWPGKSVLAPIDLGSGDRADVLAAALVANELDTALELIHVVEPIADVPWLELDEGRRNSQRRSRALARLTKLQADISWTRTTSRIESGKPAEAIARVAADSNVGLVVMTRRRGQGLFGPRQGSISYHVLTDASTPVLALPSDRKWVRKALATLRRTRAASA